MNITNEDVEIDKYLNTIYTAKEREQFKKFMLEMVKYRATKEQFELSVVNELYKGVKILHRKGIKC